MVVVFVEFAFLDHSARIMKYMGDYPSKKMRLGTDLTDQVFEHALVHVRTLDKM